MLLMLFKRPFVVKQDPGKNSSQSPPHINHHCCYGCGDSLEDIICHQCTCESCVKGAHYGYNFLPKVPIIPNPKPCNNQTIDELPQTSPSFDPTCYSGDRNSFTYDSKSNIVDDSPNVFSPHSQPPTYSYEFCRNDAYYGHDFPLQVPFTYDLEPLYINTLSWDHPTICYNDDDDEDCTIAITPILSTKKPDNSLSMGDEHLDTILAIESDKVIKSSVENLVPIPSESEGIPDNMCDVPFHDNSPPLDISKDQFKDLSDSNDDSTSIDDDSFSIDDIVGGIDEDILLTIKDDIIHEKLLNINLLIANIEALKDISTPYSDFMTKSSSTSLNFLLEETNTFDNSLLEFETFCFDLEENSSGSTTTRAHISLLDYEAFYDDHVKEISSGSTTTHSNFYLYDSFIFDLSINQFPPADRSDFYEFVDELAHIISSPEYDCFSFKNEPKLGDFTIDVVEDTFPTREPRVHELAVYINTPSWDHPTICYNEDDDEDCTIAITPILSTKKPDNSLSMGDEHLNTVLATESDKVIKSSVENLVPIPSESEGIPDNMCDVPFHDNSPPLDISKDQFEDLSDSNDDSTSIDDDSFSIDDIVGGIDEDILLTIKDDIIHEKLLNINLLIANIEALKDISTPYSNFMTKSSSTSLNFLLEETNTFDNSLLKSETFCFDLEENSSGSTTTHSNFYLYDSFIFDLSINQFPPADRSDFYEFVEELAHIMSSPEYDCFSFKNEPKLGDSTIDVVEDTFPIREPRVHVPNVLPTHPTLHLNLNFILSSESLFPYVVWIFLPFLSYSVAPQYLLSFGNEDTIIDIGISICHPFMPDVSHRSGTFMKFNVYPKHLNGSLMEILLSTCSLMDQ
nr:hypothetical protein [Tanacetum cinerariifolium]